MKKSYVKRETFHSKKQKKVLRVRDQDKIASNGHWDKKRQERHANRQKKICDYWNCKSLSFTCNCVMLCTKIYIFCGKKKMVVSRPPHTYVWILSIIL
jgi:hypothetical protein